MRYSILFENQRTKKIWVKSFRSKSSAIRAKKGILKLTSNIPLEMGVSRGSRYGSTIKKHNRKSYLKR